MRLPRLILYVAVGYVFASLLAFVFGAGGLLEYRTSAGYREQLQRNIEELEGSNLRLLAELEALRSDPELLRLRARELGYFREDERVIRIEGAGAPRNFYEVGRLILRQPQAARASWVFRAAGLGLPAVLVVLRALRRGRKGDAAAV